MKNGRVQAKDVPEAAILEALSGANGEWMTHWSGPEPRPETPFCMSTVRPVLATFPEPVMLAKLAAMKRRGLVNGCDCGCRGDWVITEQGREALNAR